MNVRVTFDVTMVVVKRDGHWAAKTDPFALTAYGNAPVQAENRGSEAILFLFKNLGKGAETTDDLKRQFSEYLNGHGVKHVITTEEGPQTLTVTSALTAIFPVIEPVSEPMPPPPHSVIDAGPTKVTRELQVLAGVG